MEDGADRKTFKIALHRFLPVSEEAKASRKALLEYCKLDTWAMVKVWERLEQRAQD